MENEYILSFCTDFTDELISIPFDRQYLKTMFSILRDWGMRRVYWIYTFRFEEGMFGCRTIKGRPENALQTYTNMGDFLPAAVETAHDLGMEIYAVYKPFDLASSFVVYPYGTEKAEQYGKMDSLGGRIANAVKSIVKNQHYRLERHPRDMENSGAEIAEIRINFDRLSLFALLPECFKIYVSNDNMNAVPYKGNCIFSEGVTNGYRTISIKNLNIKEKFVILKYNSPARGGEISNTLDRLIRLYDKCGREIPFTYCLTSGKDHWATFESCGIFYDYENGATNDAFQQSKRYSIDNERGYVILAKGKEKYIAGALSPAYKESHDVWLKHITECLDAGVDGVDLRVAQHNRSLEFERYGFEPPVIEEYKKRHGVDIIKENFNPELHRKLPGEFYTSFYRKASALIRKRGKKVQIHIGPNLISRDEFKRYMNFNWEWEKWLEDKLADAITIKGGLSPADIWETIKSRMPNNKIIPSFYCPYMDNILRYPDWPNLFRRTLDQSKELGQSGIILYETASFLKAAGNHKFELLYPELPKILKEFISIP